MKIELAKIEGYENMTAEEKIAVLEGYEFEEKNGNNAEVEKLKNALSKSNSEAAEYKRQLRDKMSEQEKAEVLRKEQDDALKLELETLRREKTISGYTARCLGLGYDDELASDTATAMYEGNFEKVFANQKLFNDKQKANFEANALKNQPGLSAGSPASKEMLDAQENAKLRSYFGL